MKPHRLIINTKEDSELHYLIGVLTLTWVYDGVPQISNGVYGPIAAVNSVNFLVISYPRRLDELMGFLEL